MEAHRAACHYADEALKADVEIAHIGDAPARRGTPTAALASLADPSPLGTGIETTEGL